MWSLAIEEQFYLFAPFLALLIPARHLRDLHRHRRRYRHAALTDRRRGLGEPDLDRATADAGRPGRTACARRNATAGAGACRRGRRGPQGAAWTLTKPPLSTLPGDF